MTTTTERPAQAHRSAFEFFETITLRFADNDDHGHVNNAHYYSFFDTAVEGYLRARGVRDLLSGEIATPVVASSCRYFKEVAFPGMITVGVRVEHIGRTSITYAVAVFVHDEHLARAQGSFTTVTTARATGQPVDVPLVFRQAQH